MCILLRLAERAACCTDIPDTPRHLGVLHAQPDAEVGCHRCQGDWHQHHSAQAPVGCPEIRLLQHRDRGPVLRWGRARLGPRLQEVAPKPRTGSQVSPPEMQSKHKSSVKVCWSWISRKKSIKPILSGYQTWWFNLIILKVCFFRLRLHINTLLVYVIFTSDVNVKIFVLFLLHGVTSNNFNISCNLHSFSEEALL